MASKFLDCIVQTPYEGVHYEKAWFPDDEIVSANGVKYELGEFIRKGSNGTIFRCAAPNGTQHAIKILHRLDEQRLARFEFETLVLQDLKHPNILPCIDAGQLETTGKMAAPFIITDLYSGNLDGLVTYKGAQSPRAVKEFTLQICSAFEYLHGKGLIHRDIKPANFLIKGGTVVVGDFGLAKTATDEGVARYYRRDITLENEFVGPILWMSPELIAYQRDKAVRVDHRSDIFQIGLVAWFLLTGELACGSLDEDEDPSGGQFWRALMPAIKHKAEKRYPNIQQMKAAIAAINI